MFSGPRLSGACFFQDVLYGMGTLILQTPQSPEERLSTSVSSDASLLEAFKEIMSFATIRPSMEIVAVVSKLTAALLVALNGNIITQLALLFSQFSFMLQCPGLRMSTYVDPSF